MVSIGLRTCNHSWNRLVSFCAVVLLKKNIIEFLAGLHQFAASTAAGSHASGAGVSFKALGLC